MLVRATVLTGVTLLLAGGALHLARRAPTVTGFPPERATERATGVQLERGPAPASDRVPLATVFQGEDAATDDPPTGSCIVRLDVPMRVPLEVTLCTYDRPLDDFVRTQRHEILPEAEDWTDWRFDPDASEPAVPVARHGDRATYEVELARLPLHRPSWLLLFSFEWPKGTTLAFAPIVVTIPPIEDASKPAVVEARIEALGGIEVHVVRRHRADLLIDERGPIPPKTIRDSGGDPGETDFDRAWIAPLVAGPHDVELLIENGDRIHRHVVHADVRDGRMTDAGTWEFDSDEPGFAIRAVSEEGEPLTGYYTLTGPGWKPTACDRSLSSDARLSLHGDWSHVESVRFHPGADNVFEDVVVALPARRPALTTIVVPRRIRRLVNFVALDVLPDGTRDRLPAVAFERAPGAAWKPVWLGENCYECGRNASDAIEPGARELIAWIGSRGLSFVGPLVVSLDADADGAPPIELRFVETGTIVSGKVHSTCEGLDARAEFHMRLRIAGASAAASYPAADRDNFSSVSPFELRGLPTDVDLELVVVLGDRELAVRPFRLAPGQTVDLGTIDVDVCP